MSSFDEIYARIHGAAEGLRAEAAGKLSSAIDDVDESIRTLAEVNGGAESETLESAKNELQGIRDQIETTVGRISAVIDELEGWRIH